jgi:glycerophosphoryl diester phosphodiesterase
MARLYAHRGAAVELPENTIPAFELAVELGADAIETDAHLTRDGQVVLSHDATGERMCGVPRRIEDVTLEELRGWDAGARFVDADGRPSQVGKGLRIPTLGEALRALPGVSFNVDAKSQTARMVDRLIEAIDGAGAADRTLVASFHFWTLRRVRRCYSGRTGLSELEVLRLFCSPETALRWLPVGGAAAQIPYRFHGIDLGQRRLVDKCHRLGLEVHYWTVNDPRTAERLLAIGVDAIMTDDPRRVAPALR